MLKLGAILGAPEMTLPKHLKVFNQKANHTEARNVQIQNRLKGRGRESTKIQYQLTRDEMKWLIAEQFGPDDYRRELLTLALLEGKTGKELAEALGFTEGGARTAVRKALARLGKDQLGLENFLRDQLDLVDDLKETSAPLTKPHPFTSVTEEEFDGAVATLKEEQTRLLLRMRFVMKYSRGDIARLMGLDPQYVSEVVRGAFPKLAKALNRPNLDRLDFAVRP